MLAPPEPRGVCHDIRLREKKHEFAEHWSTSRTERRQMPSRRARGGRLRLGRRQDSKALAGPVPRLTQAAGP